MRNNKGFTLIELLIVTVIIGILAAIAIPKFSASREKTYFAAMRAELKNLASRQEIYHADEHSYTTEAGALTFVSSQGVTVSIAASSSGWSASATHSALGTSEGCAIYYGTVTAPTSPTTPTSPGEVACTS